MAATVSAVVVADVSFTSAVYAVPVSFVSLIAALSATAKAKVA
jgi:hypothetical protein